MRSPSDLADALATALKVCAVWPRANPRVQRASQLFAQLLQGHVEHPDWLPVRVRGNGLLVGTTPVDSPSQVAEWLVARCRDVGLAGLEFAAGLQADAVVDFGVALAAAGQHKGDCSVVWPGGHPGLRPLALVFDGAHVADPAVLPGAAAGLPLQNQWQRQLIDQLLTSPEVQSRLRSFEQICGVAAHEGLALDVLKTLVEMLPMEIASDPKAAVAAIGRILAEAHVGAMAQLRMQRPPDRTGLTRLLMNVAQTWFASVEPGFGPVDDLPAGRQHDEPVTADVDALLAEIANLPDPAASLGPRAAATAVREVAAETCGIGLHVLMHPLRPGQSKGLMQILPTMLAELPTSRMQVLDAYLRPRVVDQPAAIGDHAGTILHLLEHAGREHVIRDRGYLDAGFVARTFPGSLPMCARVLGGSTAGIEILRSGLAMLDSRQLAVGAQLLRNRNALAEAPVLDALRAVGGERVLPLLRAALANELPAAKEAFLAYLRRLPLPAPEAAALHCVRSAAALPADYIDGLCRLVERGAPADESVRAQSGELLRTFVAAMPATLPLDARLVAVQSLALLPGPATTAMLQRLRWHSWWWPFGDDARAIRREARAILNAQSAEATLP